MSADYPLFVIGRAATLASFGLADLVAPQPVYEFLRTIYARSWVLYEGAEHRFRSLADWGTLNGIVMTQHFETPWIRLARQNKILPVEDYTEQVRRIASTSYRQIVVDRLLHELRNGATLIIDRVDQVHESVRKLAVLLESELKASVFVNIFASWTSVPGFDLHYDNHDIFVIQLEGRKHWKIFEPARQWPLYHDIVPNPKPETSPVGEFDMTAGDVLYLPHGWWHSVNADEPSLHITVGITPSVGIDLMTWLVDRARAHELFRRRLPYFADERQQKDYLAAIRSSWNELMASEDILDQFLTYANGTSRSRPLFDFPEILNKNSVLDRKNARIILLAPRAAVTPANDGFVFTALGRRWSFPLITKTLIDALISQNDITVEEAIKLNMGVKEEQSAQVIFTLLRAGVLALR